MQKENTELEARNTELKMHIQAIKQETQNKRGEHGPYILICLYMPNKLSSSGLDCA